MVYIMLSHHTEYFYSADFEFVFKNFPKKEELVYGLQNGKFFPFADSRLQKRRLKEALELAEVIKVTTIPIFMESETGIIFFQEKSFSLEFKIIELGY